jgi:2-aminoadipate transaminase
MHAGGRSGGLFVFWRPMVKRPALSEKARRTGPPPISWLMAAALEQTDLISLAAGFVDQETLPTEAVLDCCRNILEDIPRGRAALQYGTTIGHPRLREDVIELLAAEGCIERRGGAAGPDNVVITNGAQQLLYLVTAALVDPGDVVIIADPSYFVYMGILEGLGADVRGVATEDDGISIDGVRRAVEKLRGEGRLERLKLIYVMTYFQNPTGLTLSAEKRRELFDIAVQLRDDAPVYILEDGAYRPLCYEGEPGPPMKNFDTANDTVIYAETFCKPFSAGLKTGFGILPDALLAPVLHDKANMDFGSPNFAQCIIDQAIREGRYERHLEVVRRGYRTKLNTMLDALDEDMPEAVRWTRPQGGLYVWVTLPPGIDTGREAPFFRHALDRGVLYVPGEFCFYPEPGREKPRNCMRLSFGVAPPEKIREGVRRLAAAVADAAGQAQARADT